MAAGDVSSSGRFVWDAFRNSIWLAGGPWGLEVVGGNDLQTGGGDELLVDEDDGVSGTGSVGGLRRRIGGDGCADRKGSCWDHHGAIGACGDVKVAGVDAEGDARNKRSN